jgi:hypothetical protein
MSVWIDLILWNTSNSVSPSSQLCQLHFCFVALYLTSTSWCVGLLACIKWKSPRGGWIGKSEIYKLKHTLQAGLALELNASPKKRAKTNHKRIKVDDMVICFTEVQFLQTYSPLRWSQRSGLFQPFPSLKRSPRPSELLFSINRDTKFTQGPPHNWCLLPWLQLSWKTRKKEEEKQSKRKSSNEHKYLSL